MKLLLDVNVSPRVGALLRARGHAVERVGERLDPRSEDRAIVEAARAFGSVIITRDQDFSALVAASGQRSPSLVNLRVSVVDSAAVAEVIASVLVEAADDLAAWAR